MKFDLLAIIMMIIAVAVGQVGGGLIESYIGAGTIGGIFGTLLGILVVGALTYAIYILAVGGKFDLMMMIVFAFIVYIANLMAGYIASFTGFGGGLLTLVIVGLLASLLWGYVGGKVGAGKGTAKVKPPITV